MIRTDYNFGSVDEKGEWTGMIGMLKNNEADMALGWLATTYERHKVADYSFPYIIDSNVFVTAAPKILLRELPFLNPFQPLHWIFGEIYVLALSERIFSSTVRSTTVTDANKENIEEGRYNYYSRNKVRAFMYLWSLTKLVLVFSYSSDILASLMVPIKESPLKSVQELRDAVVAGKYQFGAFRGTSQLSNLMEVQSGIIKDLADNIRHHPENIVKTFNDSIKRMEEGKFAMMNMRLHFIYSATKIGIDRFYVAEDSIGFNGVSIAFRKGFRHLEQVNRVIHRVTECAILSKIIDGYIFRSQLKAPPPKPPQGKRALSFDDMKTTLWMLIFGQMLSISCLLIEIGTYKYKTCYAGC
ncbi:glutamate receptor ionotropic, delta-1 [Nephila pilipes]|uniref:Glutamate receptor ionotropic, delta-1 n=1 Tax=Nephila pilipes TaxID=299642 RepID=A0A8X6PNK0_NEPPI|nr:glutamate receptor ionotropic, delta-1 [Nephila pilipes]